MTRPVPIAVSALLGITLLLGGCSSGQQPSAPTTPGGSGQQQSAPSTSGQSDGAALAQEKCTQCHSFDRVAAANKDKAGWESTVDRMVGHGLQVSDTERQAIIDYLVSK